MASEKKAPQSPPPEPQPLPSSRTGVAELDTVLGGGFPKESVILLAGASGSGKTIFSFQWLFEGIRSGENGIYVSVTEPLFKSLKNVESMSFYDRKAVEQEKLKIIDLRGTYREHAFDQERIINFIEREVVQSNAKRLVIDSITAIAYSLDDKAKIRNFIFEMGQTLATLGCTTILTSEVTDGRMFSAYGVEEFISDGIIRMDQEQARGAPPERRLQIAKMRGRGYGTESMQFKITKDGIVPFAKLKVPMAYGLTTERVSTGNRMLDSMMLGGLFKGSSTFIVGSTGTGKSLFGLQFLKDGLDRGEPCFYVGFEESREQVIRNAKSFGWDLERYEREGLLFFRCVYPSEMPVEEHAADINAVVETKGITRCAVDSLSSLRSSFSPETFIGFVKNLNRYLKSRGVTTFFTAAASEPRAELSDSHLSVVFDNILMLRNVEMEGELKPVMNIIKVRGSSHSKGLRRYDITDLGIVIGQPLVGYEGITTGVTRKVSETMDERLETEFRKYMGPLGTQAYKEISAAGISEANIDKYIDSLVRGNVMTAEDAKEFRASISAILSGAPEAMEPPRAKKVKEGGVLGKLLGK